MENHVATVCIVQTTIADINTTTTTTTTTITSTTTTTTASIPFIVGVAIVDSIAMVKLSSLHDGKEVQV